MANTTATTSRGRYAKRRSRTRQRAPCFRTSGPRGCRNLQAEGLPRINDGWDHHDEVVAHVLSDRHGKWLLNQMLVVLGSEFGRTPRIRINDMTGETCTTERSRACWLGLGQRSGYRDTHRDNFGGTTRQAAVLEQAMSALFADLP